MRLYTNSGKRENERGRKKGCDGVWNAEAKSGLLLSLSKIESSILNVSLSLPRRKCVFKCLQQHNGNKKRFAPPQTDVVPDTFRHVNHEAPPPSSYHTAIIHHCLPFKRTLGMRPPWHPSSAPPLKQTNHLIHITFHERKQFSGGGSNMVKHFALSQRVFKKKKGKEGNSTGWLSRRHRRPCVRVGVL